MTSSTETSFVHVTPAGLPRVTVAYRRHGAGEPLVLLHGIGHHLHAWDPVAGALAGQREVIAVDLPGFGESPAQPESLDYTLENTVEILLAVFGELGVELPHVAGNSLGGLLALRLGQAGQARTVTALSPAGFWTEAEGLYAFSVLSAMRRGALLLPPSAVGRLARGTAGRAVLTGTIYARPGRREAAAVVAETRSLREATGFEPTMAAGLKLFSGTVGERIPVTIGWGSRDRILLRRQGARAKRAIPHARLVRLPGCGHVPMSDDPGLVARVLLDGSS